MVFSSAPFLFYFLPALAGLYLLARGRAAKNTVLLVASLVFYAWGEGAYVLLLLASIGLNHAFGARIAATARGERTPWVAAGVALNLIILGAFKYLGFLTAQLTGLGAPTVSVHLPLGISFFTFQAISYLVDVAREDAPPSPSVFRTALYISLFPQLIAGPIVRFKTIARQFDRRPESAARVLAGVRLFILGLAQKVLIADTLAGPADAAFAAEAPTAALAWMGLLAYSLQIFFDFAGYSNMAMGLGRMAGLRLPRNFDRPYGAFSVRAFWRRWHITLSAWFRDYVYIPLGGSRGGRTRTMVNLWIVFVLCGLWHGAAWTFVVWGAWHGAFLALERTRFGAMLDRAPRAFASLYTLGAVAGGWVLFRAESLAHAGEYAGALFGWRAGDVVGGALEPHMSGAVVLALIAGVALSTRWPAAWVFAVRAGPAWARVGVSLGGLATVFALSIVVMTGQDYAPFLYFRF